MIKRVYVSSEFINGADGTAGFTVYTYKKIMFIGFDITFTSIGNTFAKISISGLPSITDGRGTASDANGKAVWIGIDTSGNFNIWVSAEPRRYTGYYFALLR